MVFLVKIEQKMLKFCLLIMVTVVYSQSTPEKLERFPSLLEKGNTDNFFEAYQAEKILNEWRVWEWSEMENLISNIQDDKPTSCWLLAHSFFNPNLYKQVNNEDIWDKYPILL